MTGLSVALPIPTFLPTLGGAEIGLHNIASNLLRQGHRPVVITSFSHVRRLRREGWKLPYPVVAYPPRLLTWRSTRPRLGRWLLNRFHAWLQRRYSFDVWHATFGYPVGVAVIEFCRKRRIPHLVRCVGEDIQMNHEVGYGMRLDPAVDREIRHWLPQADQMVAITESIELEYLAIGCDAGRIVRIPNGVDLQRFRQHRTGLALRDQLQLADDCFVFLAVGRMHPKKNFPQLIEAAASLKQQGLDKFAVAIGGGGVQQLAHQVAQAGVGDCVYLLQPNAGTQPPDRVELPGPQLLDWYVSADCFLMPSLVEAFGIVTIEAMAAGLPVIAADSPGCRDVIRGGKDGILYGGDTAQLVDAMRQILNEPALLADLRDRSARRVVDFDWPAIVRNYTENYTRLITGSAPGK